MYREPIEIRGALIFDSWFEDRPILRDSKPEDRHLIYEGGGVILDLLVRKSNGQSCLHVGGQVLPDGGPMEDVADLAVVMQRGKQEVQTRTNPIGEFTFHATPDEDFDLTIRLREKQFVVRGLAYGDPRDWQLIPSAVAQTAGTAARRS